MRSRRSSQEHVAAVARRRLELLSAELAGIRPDAEDPPISGPVEGPGEPVPFDGPEPGSEPATRREVWPPPARLASDPRVPVAARAGETAPAPITDQPGPGRHAHRSVGLLAGVAGWLADRVPATARGRVRLSGSHLLVLVLVVLAAVGVTGWWVAQADGGSSAVPALASEPSVPASLSRPAASGSTGVAPAAAPSSAPPVGGGARPPGTAAPTAATGSSVGGSGGGPVVVDVAGKVRHPGIARLPQGARVIDALQAAGGPRRGVRLTSLNLARVLTDGEQIVVGVPAPAGVAAPAAGAATGAPGAGGSVGVPSGVPTTLVNVNTADQAQLETLPGVGPVTAQSILDYRAQSGGFRSVDELLEVSGIGDATLAKIAPYCTL